MPPSSVRRIQPWATVITSVPATVPITMPAMPNGSYSARATSALTTRLAPASAVVAHARWRLKKVRENSRLTPWNGSEIDHQTSAVVTRSVASRPELAALVEQARDRLREHGHQHGAGDEQQADLPHAVGHRAAQVVRGAARGQASERREQDVAIEIENRPCGSW